MKEPTLIPSQATSLAKSLNDQIDVLPDRAGVYLFRSSDGEILYVGKAKSLRARVRNYFRGDIADVKTAELVRRVAGLETIVVGSEQEALIFEANLIKEHRPRFNVQLRDDKRYPYIKVTVQEAFPRVWVTRRIVNDGARYYGPYTSVGNMRRALEVVKRLYTVRSCRYDLPGEAPSRPCLDYHIGRCQAPCIGLQTQLQYRTMIDEILLVLEGETEAIRGQVEGRMRTAADKLDFERAAQLRDVIQGLDGLAREQRVQRVGGGDHDVIGLARDGALATAVALRVRRGRLLGRDTVRFHDIVDESDAALLSSFASRYYLGSGKHATSELPREILFTADFEDRELLGETLSTMGGRRVVTRVPERGEKLRLVQLADQNARHALEDSVTTMTDAERADEALYDLQDRLDLKVVPRVMVCFDVSHIQGAETVASAAVFENGEPRKADYRHMRIRGEWGNDDYRSMAEVVLRWFTRRLEEGKPLPDLVIIDGGKGQLAAAGEALASLGVADVAVAALAKREEEIFFPNRPDPIRLDRRDRALHLLQRIRNEAHRFAVRYNRKLRTRRTIRSDIGDIPGIGPARQKALLSRFGSVKGVRAASEEEIARVPGFSRVLATRVLTYLGR
jgi:excinuclease ABC subunit C